MIPDRGAWLLSTAREKGYDATKLARAVNASRQRVGKWFAGQWPWRIEHRQGLRTVLGVTEEQLRNGPWVALTAQGGAIHAVREAAVQFPAGGLVNMAQAAEKICHALKQDLERSRALVLVNAGAGHEEHRRHQELVWSLKDLARRLHRLGFDMRNLFDVTDELAREIGLPVRPNEPPDRSEHPR